LKALFHIKRMGMPAKEPGDVDLLVDGLRVKPPASTGKRTAAAAAGAIFLGPVVGAAMGSLVKGKAFTVPYDKIVSMTITYRKTGITGPESPFIDLSFHDERGELRTISFAPFVQRGMFKREFKTQEFYNDLSRRVRAAGEAMAPTPFTTTPPSTPQTPPPQQVPTVTPTPTAPTPVARTPRFCPQCGNPVNPGDKFCSNCGAKLV